MVNEPTEPIQLSAEASAFHDGYWNDIVEELRERGFMREDELLVSLSLDVRAEEDVEVTAFEAVSP